MNKKEIRKHFNEVCLKRDKYKCVFCSETKELDVHHIVDRHDMPNGGYVLSNGITLCKTHHLDAELFHMSNGKKWVNNMHPNDLYIKIGSSYDKAFDDSEKLNKR